MLIPLVTIATLTAAHAAPPTIPTPPSPETTAPATTGDFPRFSDGTKDILIHALVAGRSMDAEIADIDRDGHPDIIVALEFAPNVVLRWNPDADRYEHSRLIMPTSMRDSEDIAIADLTGDGHADIVFASEDDQTNEYYISTPEGLKNQSGNLPVTGTSNAVLAADLDNDGDTDLIFGNAGPEAVLLNNGDGTFTEDATRIPISGDITQDLELGDIDGDGDPDLIIANEDGNRLLINNGDGIFTDETAERLPQDTHTQETREADFADVDGDGDLDLFFANVGWKAEAGPANRLLINDGSGRFTDESAARLPIHPDHFTLDADFADLDDDGDLDIVLANVGGTADGSAPVQVYRNDGSGRFTDVTSTSIPTLQRINAIDVEVFDLNRDGKPDIYVCNHSGADLALIAE